MKWSVCLVVSVLLVVVVVMGCGSNVQELTLKSGSKQGLVRYRTLEWLTPDSLWSGLNFSPPDGSSPTTISIKTKYAVDNLGKNGDWGSDAVSPLINIWVRDEKLDLLKTWEGNRKVGDTKVAGYDAEVWELPSGKKGYAIQNTPLGTVTIQTMRTGNNSDTEALIKSIKFGK